MPQQLKRNEVVPEGERWSSSENRRTVGRRDKRRYTLMTRRASGLGLGLGVGNARKEFVEMLMTSQRWRLRCHERDVV